MHSSNRTPKMNPTLPRLPILNNPLVPPMDSGYTPKRTPQNYSRLISQHNVSDYNVKQPMSNHEKKKVTNNAYIPVIDPFVFRHNLDAVNRNRQTIPPPVPFLPSQPRQHLRDSSSRQIAPDSNLKYPSRPPPDPSRIHDERTAPDQIPPGLDHEIDHLRSQASFAMQPPLMYVPPNGFERSVRYNESLKYYSLPSKDKISLTTPLSSSMMKLIPIRVSAERLEGRSRHASRARPQPKKEHSFDSSSDIFFDDDSSFEPNDRRPTTVSVDNFRTSKKATTAFSTTPVSTFDEIDVESTTPVINTNGHVMHEEDTNDRGRDDRVKYDIDSYLNDDDKNDRDEVDDEVRFKEKQSYRPITSNPFVHPTTRDSWSPVTSSTLNASSRSAAPVTTTESVFREYSPYFDGRDKNFTEIVYEPREKSHSQDFSGPKKVTNLPDTTTTTTTTTSTTSTTTTTTTTTPKPTKRTTVSTTTTTTSTPKKKTTISVVRQLSAKRSRPTNKRLVVKYKTTVPPKPPSRPKPVHPTPVPFITAEKCDPKQCKLPDCNCGSSTIPGGLKAKQVPQIVMITFDDAINDLNWEIYEEIFNSGRKNPNGCPPLGTFYVSHEWTDYGQVQTLYSRGHEMASHGVTHSFGEKFSKGQWMKEMQGQREILHLYGGVKLEDIRGMRAPFLQVNISFETRTLL